MKYTPVGVDIAKHLIQIHFIDEHTGEVVDKQLRNQDFLVFFSNREPCLIGMEACGGSQHWARELTLKLKLVKVALMASEEDRSVAALTREYSVNDNLLFKWMCK